MAKTALAEAFENVGYKSQDDRLAQIAADVLRMPLVDLVSSVGKDDPACNSKLREIAMDVARVNRKNFEKARDAFYNAVRKDASLLWAMFEPYRSMAADRFLRDGYALLAAQERREVDKKLIPGVRTERDEGQKTGAPVAFNAGAGQRGEGASQGTQAIDTSPPASITRMADRQTERMQSRLATEAKLSKLDTVLINGCPIGDCTVAVVREWAKARLSDARVAKRDAVFAMNLTANLDGGKIIRDMWKPDDVDAMYHRVEADNAA